MKKNINVIFCSTVKKTFSSNFNFRGLYIIKGFQLSTDNSEYKQEIGSIY